MDGIKAKIHRKRSSIWENLEAIFEENEWRKRYFSGIIQFNVWKKFIEKKYIYIYIEQQKDN